MDSSFDGDDLSTALGTETLAGREMVPEGFENARQIKGIEDLGARFRVSLAR
jgi:hypothetical protein